MSNQNSGGEVTYLWQIIDQPSGPADSLSATNIQSPTFTPKKEGTYLIKLIVNQSLPSAATNLVIVGVKQLKLRERIPAAQESLQDNSLRGWATAVDSFLQHVDTSLADPGVIIGVAGTAGLVKGNILRATATATIKATLPGEEKLPSFVIALATTASNIDELLGVLEGGVDGSSTPGNGTLVKVRIFGRYSTAVTGGGAIVGEPVFVSDTGGLVRGTPGTNRRVVGSVLSVSGGTFDVMFFGGIVEPAVSSTVLGTGAPGQLTYWTNPSTVSGDNSLFWNIASKRLGLGTTTPNTELHIKGLALQTQITFEPTEAISPDIRIGPASAIDPHSLLLTTKSSIYNIFNNDSTATDSWGVYRGSLSTPFLQVSDVGHVTVNTPGGALITGTGTISFLTDTTFSLHNATPTADFHLTQRAFALGATFMKIDFGAHGPIAPNFETIDSQWNLDRVVTWSTGALTLQRFITMLGPTIAFSGASTATDAITLEIGGPVAGSNATITNSYAIRCPTGSIKITSGFLDLGAGSTFAVSAASRGRLRYNQSTQHFEISENGGAYAQVSTGAGSGMSIGGTVTSGTTGSVLFVATGPVLAQDNANFFWDNTTKSLGIGTAPGAKLHVNDTNKTVASGNVNSFVGTTDTQAADVGGTFSLGGNIVGATTQVPFAYIWGRKETSTSGNEAGYLAFGTRTTGAANERMRITSDGGLQFTASTSAVGASSTGKLRYNSSSQKFEVSLNAAAYVELATANLFVPQTRTLTAGAGLTGGGDLSADRTFDVGAGSGILSNTNDVAVDQSFQFNWTAVHSWKTHAAFTGSAIKIATGAVQTTNTTQTTAFSFTLADTTAYWFYTRIVARESSGADRILYERKVLVYREGGGATIEGAGSQVVGTDIESAGATTWDATFTTNSNDIRVSVTGAAGTTINWSCTVTYQAISGNV